MNFLSNATGPRVRSLHETKDMYVDTPATTHDASCMIYGTLTHTVEEEIVWNSLQNTKHFNKVDNHVGFYE
jgi:hypothetical protein